MKATALNMVSPSDPSVVGIVVYMHGIVICRGHLVYMRSGEPVSVEPLPANDALIYPPKWGDLS
jgi:hypothetical protein